mmetsp:Transcript_76245/g.223521  ORF Transcript_76245/g.223521 Transcript_76245/m.223521 type:complete len:214 (+) Transcript_76245:54-695(+)
MKPTRGKAASANVRGHQLLEQSRKLPGEWCPAVRQACAFPSINLQPPGMQEELRAPWWSRATVKSIPDQCMSLVAQVCPDLMLPACVQQDLHKTHGGGIWTKEVADAHNLCESRPAPEPNNAPRRSVFGHELEQRQVQKPGRQGDPAVAEAHVALAQASGRKLQPDGVVARIGPGPEHRPRGFPVKPMEEAMLRKRISGDEVLCPQPLCQPFL